ncbi:tetratricopeptide repeat protein [Thiolinea disciformis]|uniref:tetratricopeptide repeat protein n=1 Tax=Thiolinea disciformis TaxID=125614 RepID=UPI00037394A6|nr:tetratricopeptide repeat protein [Thiolinea disciformis]
MGLFDWFRKRPTTLNNPHGVAAHELVVGAGATVNTGVQVVQHFPAELLAEMKKLGIAEGAINSFFRIVEEAQIPPEDWDAKLRQYAQDYQYLKEQVKKLSTNSMQGVELKAQATAAIEAGEFDQAKQLFDEIRALNMQAAKQNILFAAEADAANGALARTRFRYLESGKYYERAAQTLLVLGREHEVQAAECLGWAGRGFNDGGKYPQAQPLYERSLAISEQTLGKEHPSVGTSLNNLAGLYESMGEYAKALPLYERSLAISEQALGKEHPDVGTSLNNLAGLYRAMGEYAKALPLFERALAIVEKSLGAEHPNTKKVRANYEILLERLK